MINAKIVADSISKAGKRITTFELEYPRYIHSEMMTHRALSKNSASSRAIPLKTMLSLVWNNMAMPFHWGQNQSGMQAKTELSGWKRKAAELIWIASGRTSCVFAWLFDKIGLHKQVANRILEPWSHIKIVVTGTDWDNFFHLRNHPDAQPDIHELARIMYDFYQMHIPRVLSKGEWHLPYVDNNWISQGMTLDDAKKLSASLCAQVSYRKFDESIEKALSIYDRLVNSTPVHASPFEHQATPLDNPDEQSGNFRGWHQFRQDLPNHVCLKYIPKE